ncbi:MAG: class 1 fructose-bisphosphatase [Zoogloeaceae bacterium]|jgi:fructose-1,6-bisphosphatase I|nr:class 1 fructose-bisphosphatase [Zoogloeaceae bacterium]
MAHPERISLAQHLAAQADLPDGLIRVLESVAEACVDIAALTAQGALAGILGEAGHENVQGEAQKKLDVLANDLMLAAGERSGQLAAMASEELDWPCVPPEAQGDYLLLFDPLDGSSNIDVNVSIGTIFSVLPALRDADWSSNEAAARAFLQAGVRQLAAGYVIYGPATLLTLTTGKGVDVFTLDAEEGVFFRTREAVQIPPETGEFAINMSNQRHWEAPVRHYIDDLLAGKTGIRGKDFNLRWVASMVADVHRILTRGGVFLYPVDARNRDRGGRLRLMYEANPMAWLVEQAGGTASTGRGRLLEVVPETLHQRVPVMLGSRQEVETLVRLHAETV